MLTIWEYFTLKCYEVWHLKGINSLYINKHKLSFSNYTYLEMRKIITYFPSLNAMFFIVFGLLSVSISDAKAASTSSLLISISSVTNAYRRNFDILWLILHKSNVTCLICTFNLGFIRSDMILKGMRHVWQGLTMFTARPFTFWKFQSCIGFFGAWDADRSVEKYTICYLISSDFFFFFFSYSY